MSPGDSQTAAEGRVVHPLFEERLSRLQALRDAMDMPAGRVVVDRDMALELKRELDIIEQGG